jgi:putative ABC transport system permease protein
VPMGEMRATRRFALDDKPAPPAGREPVAIDLPVGPGYFDVMGIAVMRGRTFTDQDNADAPAVMIVSEQFARAMYGSENPVGRRVRFYSGRPGGTPPPTREIVGVVRDVRQDGVRTQPIPQMYSPYAQTAWSFASFFVLTDGNPNLIAPSVSRIVAEIDPERPARDIQSTSAIVRGSTDRQRAITWMLLSLAALALILASVGLYGVSATVANARSRELAIRAAIGAETSSLLRLVLRQSMSTAMLGVLTGVAGSLVVTRGLDTLLYEVPARDPLTLGVTAFLLLVVTILAGYVPACRVLARNPAEVLRMD